MTKDTCVKITGKEKVALVGFTLPSITDDQVITTATEQVGAFVEENHPKMMVFDFEGVKFFSSQLLGLLLATRDKLHACRGEVVISGINPQLHRIFRITNLDRVFKFFPDKQKALNSDSKRPDST